MSVERSMNTRTPRTTVANVKRMVLASVALVFAASCTNDHKSLVEPTNGLAHIPTFSTSSTTSSGGSFTTDKDDYSPGETVNLAGAGWQPADVLDIHLDVAPQNHPPVDWTVTVGDDGSFTDGSYLVQDSDAGTTLTITATSQTTGESATATFTDNPCPGSTPTTAISASTLAFTKSTSGSTTTYGVATSNQSSSGGIPGVLELCVYHDGAVATPTASNLTALYDSWTASIPMGGATRIEFSRPGGNPTNLPLDGSTVDVGKATYSTLPTSETIVAHIILASECGGTTSAPLTCFRVLSPEGGGGGEAEGPSIEKDVSGSYNNTYAWTITKDVDKTLVRQVGGNATFTYTIKVHHDDGTISDVKVSGTITVTNPNADDITADVTDALSDATACTVTGGLGATLASGPNTFAYSCDLSALPQGALTNKATVTWSEQTLSPSGDHLAAGSADFTSGAVSFTENKIDECVDVTDSQGGNLGPACVGDANPTTFTYSRTISVPQFGCQSYDNTATFTTNDTGATGSAGQTVTVCGPARTGALTMGFWKGPNGNSLIKNYCSGTSGTSLATYLAGLGSGAGPFTDAAGKTCTQLVTYVNAILGAASASDMNKMLKAQMLATALDVYFSDPLLGYSTVAIGSGKNQIKPPSNFLTQGSIGGFVMDLTAVCPMVDNLSTGTATCLNNTPSTNGYSAGAVPWASQAVSGILSFAATLGSSPWSTGAFTGTASNSSWYGTDRTKQEILKNIFDQINNQMAFAP
jgi:hypothetical protein